MSYYFNTLLNTNFSSAEDKVRDALKSEGFGILTEIDVTATLKNKLDVDYRPYKILGACNPSFAYKALQVENKIGTMLPCNVIIQELENGKIEVAAVDPAASMTAIENDKLAEVSSAIREKLKKVIESI